MYSKVNYAMVGLFVLLFGVGLVTFGFWLAKYGLEQKVNLYKLQMRDSVAGLSKDSNVQLHGVTIGRVREVSINPQNIEVIEILLEINQQVPIKEDMVASTQMLGVTGLLSIEISGGSNGAKTLLPNNQNPPLIASKPSSLAKLANNLISLTERLDGLLSPKNVGLVENILENTQQLTHRTLQLEQRVLLSLEETDKTLYAFRDTLDGVESNFAKATQDFHQIQRDFSSIKSRTIPAIETLTQTTQNFNRTTLEFEKSLEKGEYSLKKILQPSLVDFNILTSQLLRVTKSLEDNPSNLLFLSREPLKGPGE